MILTDETFDYSCTSCPRTGTPCAAGMRLAKQLGRALTAGGSALPDDFEMTGHGRLDGCCGDACGVVYSLYKGGFGVFCGVQPDSDPARLMGFARAFLGDGEIGAGPFPRAMVIARQTAQPGVRPRENPRVQA